MTLPLQKLNHLIEFVWDNPHCSLYKDYWQSHGVSRMPQIQNLSDWERLPCISRAILNDSPDPDSRLFIPKQEVDVLGFTNGTSGKKPFFFWRHILDYPHGLLYFSTYEKYTAGPIMHFYPSHKAGGIAESARQAGLQTIAGDAHQLEASARLATQIGVKSLLIPPTLGLILADYFDAQNISTRIIFIALWGEYCSKQTYKALQKRFPNAFFMFELGASEAAGLIAESTSACEAPYKHLHTRDDHTFVEIIDNEIVITALRTPYAMPLVRYKMGDAATFIDEPCPCGKTEKRIEILGRIDGDFVRVGGGEVRAEELDRVMINLLHYIEPTYCLLVDEKVVNNKKVGVLELEVTIKPNITTPESSLALTILRELTNNMRLSQTMRLSDAITKNLMQTPQIKFVPSLDPSVKHKKIVNNIPK